MGGTATLPTRSFADEERVIRALKASPSVQNPFAVAAALKKRGAFAEEDIDESVARKIASDAGENALNADMLRAILREHATDTLGVQSINAEGFSRGEFAIFSAEPNRPIPLPDGTTRDPYTSTRLRDVVRNFGRQGRVAKVTGGAHQPPIVVGHDEKQEVLERADLPRAAGISGVRFDETVGPRGMLFAQFDEMHPQARRWIEQGTFPERSAEFYPDFHGLGPHLRRVAMLGGEIPAKHDLGGTIFFNAEDASESAEWIGFTEDTMAEHPTVTPVAAPVAATDPMAAMLEQIRQAITAKAGTDEAQLTAVREMIAQATGMAPEMVSQIVRGEIAATTDQVQAILQALGLSATPAPSPQPVTMQEDEMPKKPEEQPAKDVKPEDRKPEDVDKNAGHGATPQRFAEVQAGFNRVSQQYEIQQTTLARAQKRIASLETDRDAAVRSARGAHWDSFGERLHASGQASGEMLTSIVSTLKSLDGVDKFAEGQPTGAEAVARLLETHLPRVDTSGTIVSAKATGDDKFSELKSRHAEYVAYSPGPDPITLEEFAAAEGVEKDVFAEMKTAHDKAVASI